MAHLTLEMPTLQKNEAVVAARYVVLALDGVRAAVFNPETHLLVVDYNPLLVVPELIEARLMQDGFPPSEVVSSLVRFVEEMRDAVAAHSNSQFEGNG